MNSLYTARDSMQEPKNTTAYRIVLSLSLAFFFHVLVAMVIGNAFQLPEERESVTVSVRIAPQGQGPEQSAASTRDQQSSESRSQDAKSGGQAPVISSDSGDQAAPIQAPPQTRTPGRPDISSTSPEAGSTDSTPSFRQLFGNRSPETEVPSDEAEITRLSRENRRNLSDYEIKLWERIAGEIRYEEALADLRDPRTVTLELRLMDNGALRRARIAESSGSEALDSLGRQAALSASPFPEPPDGSGRFRVRLIFEPPNNSGQ